VPEPLELVELELLVDVLLVDVLDDWATLFVAATNISAPTLQVMIELKAQVLLFFMLSQLKIIIMIL